MECICQTSFWWATTSVGIFGKIHTKVAITTHRIIEITDAEITFKYKDYKDGNKQKEMTLSHEEFYGDLSNIFYLKDL